MMMFLSTFLISFLLNFQVKYYHGSAILLESDLRSVSNDCVSSCLQTKWPNIEVNWDNNRTPSLN